MGFPDTKGIDINPGENNPYVIRGDFNHMPFEDNSFNSVYTNCIDHAWDLGLLSIEVSRVLVPSGIFILEIGHLVSVHKEERFDLIKKSSKYESIIYDKSSDIVKNMPEFSIKVKYGNSYGRIILVLENV
jgi:SAM-dependent methyltransferase